MRVWGTVQNTLKGGGMEKRGGKTSTFKMEGKLGQGVDTLKRGALIPPFELCLLSCTYLHKTHGSFHLYHF